MATKIPEILLRRIPLSEIQNDLSRFIREAEGEAIVVTRDGKAAGLLVGFASEDDWFEYSSKTTRASCAASKTRGKAAGEAMGQD